MPIPTGLIPSPFQNRVNPALTEDDFIPVSGQAVPLWLVDPEKEYHAFRNTVGLIDFSMLFKWEVSGTTATETVNKVFSRDVEMLSPGSIAYGVIVDETGHMMDDVTVLKYSDSHYRITGGNFEDETIIRKYLANNALKEVRSQVATLSVQGPNSRKLLQSLTNSDLSNEAFPYYTFETGVSLSGIPAHINRMGFTAELGYEVMVDASHAEHLWDLLTERGAEFGAVACGAIALMTVRVESGMIMGELEYDHTSTPFECRMGWSVDLEKSDFHGKQALSALKDKAEYSIVSAVINAEADGLDGAELTSGEIAIGYITMAIASPYLSGKTLALMKVRKGFGKVGNTLQVTTTAGTATAEIVTTPVYDPERLKVRS
jgi:aminomethyltransferase